jgi:nicotinate-nucleotide--dimethylbenzimidazole phosphoribosyltransferase
MTALAEKNSMPFNDILSLIQNIPDLDISIAEKHDARSSDILENPSDLGIFDALSRHICISQNRYPPMVLKPEIAIFVGNQGVENSIDPTMPTVIATMVESLQSGKHIVNQACNVSGCGLKTYDLNSELPTENITIEAAMTEVEATQVIAYSMESVRDSDLLIISDLGCHQKIAAYALLNALFFNELSNNYVFHKAIDKAIAFHGINHPPLELLRRLGSREIAAMVGAIIAARYQNVPIILDGLSAMIAAAIIFKINPDGIHHCLLGHAYADDLHSFLANQLGLSPISLLDISLDVGIGSTIALNTIKTAIYIHNYTNK